MVNIKNLENNGYQKFMDQFKKDDSLPNSPYKGTWQKCIRDDKGKKYFINFEMWDFLDSSLANKIPNKNQKPSFPSHSQMEFQNGQNFKVSLFYEENQTLEEIEAWYEKQWKMNEASYYEKYED